MGLIFTKGDLKEVREEVAKYKVIDMRCPFALSIMPCIGKVIDFSNSGS